MYEQYKHETRDEYKELMEEFEFRCHRAAMMNYYEASENSKTMYRLEYFAAFLACVSLTTIGAWFLPRQTDLWFGIIGQFGGVGVVGVVAAFIVELISKGSTQIIPSFSQRAEMHVEAGAYWQALAQKARSYMIQLVNPTLDVPSYVEWYHDLITQREKICATVIIPESTYTKFDDPELVIRRMKQRKELFQQYMDLQRDDADNN